jgi:predicted DsbA family dithiol-disulfide isomerase
MTIVAQPQKPVRITYYLDITSSWCMWVEPVWAELRSRYENRCEFDWKIALMDASGMPVSREQCEWFYRRSGTIMKSPFMLNSGWFEVGLKEYLAPNLLAEAARDLGVRDDKVRIALARGGVIEGRRIGQFEESLAIACAASGLDAAALASRAKTGEVEQRVRATTAEYHAFKMTQRPSFLMENAIGDRAVFSGTVTYAPLAAMIDAMLDDAAAYASHAVHYGGPPNG